MSDPYIGEIRLFAFRRAPVGWVACNGQPLSIANYQTLYLVIGTTYGGDGITTFNAPDLRGRVPVSYGQEPGQPAYVLGQQGGTETVTLSTLDMASHAHSLTSATIDATTATPGLTVHLATITPSDKTLYAPVTSVTSFDIMNPLSVRNAGGNASHNNMMPSLVMNFCIATEGYYPNNN